MTERVAPLPLRTPPKRAPITTTSALIDVVALAILSGLFVAICVLFVFHGLDYYRTPLTLRGYHPAHRLLRPSGLAGHLLGVGGTLVLFATLPYVARKRIRRLSKVGSLPKWLEFHIFCGVFGPILVTLHTAFKFNGIISVAYWSMVLVVVSGFVGRYLYVRIPKSIRGEELSQAEVEERARELKRSIAETGLPPAIVARIEGLEETVALRRSIWKRFAHRLEVRRKAAALRREILALGQSEHFVHEVLELAHERSELVRRIARLKKTRALFQTWHVFHRPFVWVMFGVFFIHLAVAIYFGYTIFGSGGAQ